MSFIKEPKELKEIIFTNPTYLQSPRFVFTYGPMIVNNAEIFRDKIDEYSMATPYMVPFKYITALSVLSKQSTATDCKSLLGKFSLDLDKIESHYETLGQNNWFVKNMRNYILEYVKTFIAGIREHQHHNGILENTMMNYSPILPYSNNITKAEFDNLTDTTPSSKPRNIHTFIQEYTEIFNNDDKLIEILGKILLTSTLAICNNYEVLHNIHSVTDLLIAMDNNTFDLTGDLMTYYGSLWLMENNYNPNDLMAGYGAYTKLSNSTCPLSNMEFNNAFESLLSLYLNKTPDDFVHEAWSSLSIDEQSSVDDILQKNKVSQFISDAAYDFDYLMSEIHTKQHIEFAEYANQFFTSELMNANGVKIISYNVFDDNMIMYELSNEKVAIPYVDLADDYKIKAIIMDKNHNIEEIDDISSIE